MNKIEIFSESRTPKQSFKSKHTDTAHVKRNDIHTLCGLRIVHLCSQCNLIPVLYATARGWTWRKLTGRLNQQHDTTGRLQSVCDMNLELCLFSFYYCTMRTIKITLCCVWMVRLNDIYIIPILNEWKETHTRTHRAAQINVNIVNMLIILHDFFFIIRQYANEPLNWSHKHLGWVLGRTELSAP